jgi:hypothetical protein
VAVRWFFDVLSSANKRLELKSSDMLCPFNTINGLGNVFKLGSEVFYCQVSTLFTHVDEAEKDFV